MRKTGENISLLERWRHGEFGIQRDMEWTVRDRASSISNFSSFASVSNIDVVDGRASFKKIL